MENFENNSTKFKFLAINKEFETNIVTPIEKEATEGYVKWGGKNNYPNYLYTLYQDAPTLHTIVNGLADYVVGNGVTNNSVVKIDSNLIRDIAMSIAIWGGVALNVRRNRYGSIADIVVLNFMYVRSNKDNTMFFYSEDYGNRKKINGTYFLFPKFDKNDTKTPSSVYYWKMTQHTTYPLPLWSAVVTSAEVEKSIGIFHLNSIKNGFASNILISFNNGFPDDKQQNEIEEGITEKFTGEGNACRPMISFSEDKEHAPEITKIDTNSFADRYSTMSKKVQSDLFAAFRCNPNLFGIPTEKLGFSQEEYEETFKIFNRFTVKPIQNVIKKIFDEILNEENSIEIKPFSFE